MTPEHGSLFYLFICTFNKTLLGTYGEQTGNSRRRLEKVLAQLTRNRFKPGS